MTIGSRVQSAALSLVGGMPLLGIPYPALSQSYLDRLTAAEPAAAALLVSKARDWRIAPEIVKDRAAFMIFTKPFTRKSKMSPNDLIACIDDASKRAEPDVHMQTVIRTCTQ
jgi:hypothetical protein